MTPTGSSPPPPPPPTDIETGVVDVQDIFDDPFDIVTTKNASTRTLRRWRVRNFNSSCMHARMHAIIID
ncbi:hypothetical protein Hdeb2414_s0165g00819731 [Helianthus debilis subsp. tardiflorus]